MAQGLSTLKLPVGSCIPLLAENSSFFIVAYFSIIKAGYVCVPLDPKISIKQFELITELCSSQISFIQSKTINKLASSFSGQIFSEENYFSLEKRRAILANSREEDTAVILFTSGSTGVPKGVMLSHRNIISNANSILQYLPISSSDILEMVLPFFYSFGLSALHTHIKAGASVVINNKFMFPSSVMKDINDYRCTSFYGVPSHFQMLMRNTNFLETDMPSLKYMAQAGGKLSSVFVSQLCRALPNVKLFLMYGATEATARLSYLSPEMISIKGSSVGKAIPGVILKIITKDGSEAKPHECGEIWAFGNNIMQGYFKDPELSKEVLVDGWLRTGDIGNSDDEGFIYIVDRDRDFIKSAGYRISSKEIEDIILQNTNVLEVAVIGIADELIGEAVRAFVVAKAGFTLSKEIIINDCMAKLPPHKIPRSVILLVSLPKGANGKVLKAELHLQLTVGLLENNG